MAFSVAMTQKFLTKIVFVKLGINQTLQILENTADRCSGQKLTRHIFADSGNGGGQIAWILKGPRRHHRDALPY
jgi:hypothetical protein